MNSGLFLVLNAELSWAGMYVGLIDTIAIIWSITEQMAADVHSCAAHTVT